MVVDGMGMSVGGAASAAVERSGGDEPPSDRGDTGGLDEAAIATIMDMIAGVSRQRIVEVATECSGDAQRTVDRLISSLRGPWNF